MGMYLSLKTDKIKDKNILEIYEKYYDEILNTAEYIDNVLEKFETSYKNEFQIIKEELDYLFGEIYTMLGLLNLLKVLTFNLNRLGFKYIIIINLFKNVYK